MTLMTERKQKIGISLRIVEAHSSSRGNMNDGTGATC